MLKNLEISNYAIIDKINIDFSDKLTIITGETGAGKSILMGALSLILGKRADLKSLFDESRKCFIEGVFDIKDYDLQKWFDQHEFDYQDELIIRREISASGKSRAFLNDGLVTLNILKDLSIYLLDIFAQFDNLELQHQDEQFKILDTLADQLDSLKIYQSNFEALNKEKRRLDKLKVQLSEQLKEQDYLKFQSEEIETLDLKEGEYNTLEEKQKLLTQSADIQNACSTALALLKNSESSVQDQLSQALSEFRGIRSDLPKIVEFIERLESSLLELEDLTNEVEQFDEADLAGGDRLEDIESRLSSIYSLLRKHQLQDGDQLLSLQNNLVQQLSSTRELEDEINGLENNIKTQEERLDKEATKLSKKRNSVQKKIEKDVGVLLDQLAMSDAKLVVELKSTDTLNRMGKDKLEFLFTANLGAKPQPIRQVASGGEMSRLNLCLKSLVAGKSTLPTLIFDEIDTGISGMVAEKMGSMIHNLAKSHQIISITHSPQIAAKANQHYFVYKEGHTGKTKTKVRALSKEERITEIATMLSTNPPSKNALANAKELLKL